MDNTTKVHINSNNEVKPCLATKRKCTFAHNMSFAELKKSADTNTIIKAALENTEKINAAKAVPKKRANSSQGEKLLLGALVARSLNQKAVYNKAISDFLKLDNSNKYKSLTNISRAELEQSVNSCFDAIKQATGLQKLTLSADPNNRKGADLFVEETGEDIELKFGKATDANIGQKAAIELLPFTLAKEIQRFCSATEINKHQDMVSEVMAGTDYILASRTKPLEVIAKLYKANPKSKLFKLKNQKILNDYYKGRNIKVVSSDTAAIKPVIRLEINQDTRTWEQTNRKTLKLLDKWTIRDVTFSDSKRLTFVFENTSKATIRMVVNCKNNIYYDKANDKWIKNKKSIADMSKVLVVESKYMLGTPSFNLWITQ